MKNTKTHRISATDILFKSAARLVTNQANADSVIVDSLCNFIEAEAEYQNVDMHDTASRRKFKDWFYRVYSKAVKEVYGDAYAGLVRTALNHY